MSDNKIQKTNIVSSKDSGEVIHIPSSKPNDEQKPISLDTTNQNLTNNFSLDNIDQRLQTLQDLDYKISKKIDALEALDINLQIIDYKLYYTNYQFREKINKIKEEKEKFLESPKDHSELSLILNDIDKKILDLQNEDNEQRKYLNQLKISKQEEIEKIIFQLEDDTANMEEKFEQYESIITLANNRSQLCITEDVFIKKDKLESHLKNYLNYRIAGWKLESSEIALTDTLNNIGLKCTPSNKLLTQSGSLLSFEEAQKKGFFKNLEEKALEKLQKILQEQEYIDYVQSKEKTQPTPSKKSSASKPQFTSEDVKYLKDNIGKVLTLAIAEIVTRQPKDPIHYLGHYLFKYRYNQDIDEIEKKEVEELTRKRKSFVKKRWNKFIQNEARNAVVDMIIRAEELAYRNELRRIEMEQQLNIEENE